MTQIYEPGTEPTSRRRRPAHYTPTPEHRLTPQAQGVPDDPIQLLPAWTPCAVCGQAAPKPNGTNGRVQINRWAQAPGGQLMAQAVSVVASFMLTRCDDCHEMHRRAQAIVKAHPGLAGRRGPDLAVEGVESVLVALGLLGAPLLGPEVADRDLGLHLRHLDQAGSSVAWQGRAVAGMCNSYPFAHVRLSERRRLRAAYAGLLRERVALTAPPVKVPPPRPEPGPASTISAAGGCLMCGLAAQTLPADAVARLGGADAAAREVWTAKWVSSAAALGGRPSPAPISGHLCRVCAEAAEAAGALGPTALTLALISALAPNAAARLDPDPMDRLALGPGQLRGWGALVADAARSQLPAPPPGRTPWAHLGTPAELDRLAADLRRTLVAG